MRCREWIQNELKEKLRKLYPLENQELMLQRFIKQWLLRLLGIIGAIVFLIVIFLLTDTKEENLKEGNVLNRPEYGENSLEVKIKAKIEEDGIEPEELSLEIEPEKYTQDEFEFLVKESIPQLESYVLGNNVSPDEITENMIFPEKLFDMPIEIRWESDNEDVLKRNGELNEDYREEDSIVLLTAVFSYEKYKMSHTFGVMVKQKELSRQEKIIKSLFLKLEEVLEATKEEEEFATEIFEHRQYYQITLDENNVVYAGIPIEENEEITAVVVFVDRVPIDEKTFFLSVSILFGCLLVATAISGVLSFFLAKRFVKPIHKIADATKEIAGGNYLVKTEVKDKDEIGTLAKEVDILAEKLDLASRESERMNQMQKDYIANISHELRTPVAVLRSSLEALCDDVVPKDQIEEYEKQMLTETIALQRLVNDMLEISRLENKDFPIEKEEVDLLMVLEDTLRAGRMIAIEKNMEVCYEAVEDEWLIEGDYGRLKQMFLAVLDNAVKYSEENTKITIQATAKSEDYYISIQDEGYGIPEAKQKYIFNKFYRTENSSKTGSGLGMVIVKKIAERHGIDIRLHSVEGKGTKVTFIVPINDVMVNNR